jgi:hypothetical protein
MAEPVLDPTGTFPTNASGSATPLCFLLVALHPIGSFPRTDSVSVVTMQPPHFSLLLTAESATGSVVLCSALVNGGIDSESAAAG